MGTNAAKHFFFCKIFLLIKNNEMFTDSDLEVTHILSCFTVNFSHRFT